MNLLRNVLRWQALLWALFGLVLVIAPRWLVERAFNQPPLEEDAWLRLAGVLAIVMAAQMVLVARRIEDLWWWSWSFLILEGATSAILWLNAIVGVPEGYARWPWWILGNVSALFFAAQLLALAKAGTERSPM